MELKDAFNSMNPTRENDNVLRVFNGVVYQYYDFAQRQVFATSSQSTVVMPFSQIDREVLVELREKLIALKGNPPELPQEAPANPGNTRSLRP